MRELNSFKDLESLIVKLDRLENNANSEKDPLKKDSMAKMIASIKDQIAEKEHEKISSGEHRKIGENEDLMFL